MALAIYAYAKYARGQSAKKGILEALGDDSPPFSTAGILYKVVMQTASMSGKSSADKIAEYI